MAIQPDVFPVSAGIVVSTDGKEWVASGPVADGPFAVDLYNDCTMAGDNLEWEKQLDEVVIDKDRQKSPDSSSRTTSMSLHEREDRGT